MDKELDIELEQENKQNDVLSYRKLREDKTEEENENFFMLPVTPITSGMSKLSERTVNLKAPYLFKAESTGDLRYTLRKPLDKYFKGRTLQAFIGIVCILNKRGVSENMIEGKNRSCLVISNDDIKGLFNKDLINQDTRKDSVRQQLSRIKKNFIEELKRIKNIEIERILTDNRTSKAIATANGDIFDGDVINCAKLTYIPLKDWFIKEIKNAKAREYPKELLMPYFENCANLLYGIWTYITHPKNFVFNANEKVSVNMTLKTALENCPDLPSQAEVKEKYNYRYKQEIIDPFIKRVKLLNEVNGLEVTFLSSDKKPLNIDTVQCYPIEEFKLLYLQCVWSGARFVSSKQADYIENK